jgi:hypothetical protein
LATAVVRGVSQAPDGSVELPESAEG